MMQVIGNMVVIMLQYMCINQHFYTLNLCNMTFQLYLSKAGIKNLYAGGFPGGAVVGSLPANAGDAGSSLGLGGSHMPRSN